MGFTVLSEGGLFSVALSFASPRPGITRHAARMEFGLSSPGSSKEFRSDHVARSEPYTFYTLGGRYPAALRRRASGLLAVGLVSEPPHPLVHVDASGFHGRR